MSKIQHRDYPIPINTNLVLTLICSILHFSLLYMVSMTGDWRIILLISVLFGINMILIYSLLHEAAHRSLHPLESVNKMLGKWLSLLFITSFSFLMHSHLSHHKKNRTDKECWDICLEGQTWWKRAGNLYLMMIGFGYLSIWLSVLLFSFMPPLVYSSFFKSHAEIEGFLKNSDAPEQTRVYRIESISVVIFWLLIFAILKLNIISFLCCYLVAGFIWSSQNYVPHAFSPRDIIHGAHNLKLPAWTRFIYLNFNWHLSHHENPSIPWIHLKHFVKPKSLRIGFFQNYLRLWMGPRKTDEPDPAGNSTYLKFSKTEL